MSCWIEFHAARIKRLQKFSDFRKDLSLSVNEALGCLGSFWGEVIEIVESGDITGCSLVYVTEMMGLSLNPERVWTALVKNKWVDVRPDGTRVIHDWLDCAGAYLRGKYAGSNREKLVEIWALHGRIYGKATDSNRVPIGSQLDSNRKSITPKRLGKVPRSSPGKGDARGKPESEIRALAVYAFWKKIIKASARKADALKWIERRGGEITFETLVMTIVRYRNECNEKRTEEKFLKECANFFGEDATFEGFLPDPDFHARYLDRARAVLKGEDEKEG